jgi:CRP/FNR family transcriptional regulator, anaerobic regulatory protein
MPRRHIDSAEQALPGARAVHEIHPGPDADSGCSPDCNQVRWETTADCRHCPIRQQALFAALRGPDFEHILTPIRSAVIPAGTTLYREDAPGAAVYTVSHGLLKLIKGVDGTGGRIVRLLGPGAAAGLESLSTGLYWHTAVAVRQTELCRIPLEVFHELQRQNVQLADRVVDQWEQQVQSADRWLAELGQGTVAERVQRLLAVLAEMEEDDGALIQLPPMMDLASILGTTRESVSRALAELKRAKALRRVAPHTYECDLESH